MRKKLSIKKLNGSLSNGSTTLYNSSLSSSINLSNTSSNVSNNASSSNDNFKSDILTSNDHELDSSFVSDLVKSTKKGKTHINK